MNWLISFILQLLEVWILKNKTLIWIEHSQICMQQLKISFSSTSNPSKSTFVFENFCKRGGGTPRKPPTPNPYKMITCPLAKVLLAPLQILNYWKKPFVKLWSNWVLKYICTYKEDCPPDKSNIHPIGWGLDQNTQIKQSWVTQMGSHQTSHCVPCVLTNLK